MNSKISLIAAISLTAFLAGCGGGGGGSASTGDSITVGVITGFGSVYVNGVEYETHGTSFHLDDQSGDESDLETGMVVALRGTVNPDGVTGVATSIDFRDEVEGYVLATSLQPDGTGTINVMGQNVIVSSLTMFESDDPLQGVINDLQSGDIVEVSGHSSGDGDIYATRIEARALADEIELKGVVSGLTATTFTIGSLIIDYSSASQVPGDLADDLYVEVKGNNMPTSNGDGTYTFDATSIEREGRGMPGVYGDDGDEIEIEGVVTSITGLPGSFELDGQLILVGNGSDDDDEDDRLDPSMITMGMHLVVEGYFNADGVLVADEFEQENDSDSEVQGTITAIDYESGTITIGTQVVTITLETIMHDSQDEGGYVPERYFDIGDLIVGDYVEVHYYVDSTSSDWVATKLEREDPAAS